MARGVNKVILIGNLGAAPETRVMPSGNPVTKLRVATSEAWRDRQTGERQERTEWHTVVYFNRLAEVCDQYLAKGSKIYVEGTLRTRKWQGQDGQDRYTTEIRGGEMQMLDGAGGQGGQGQPRGQQYQPQNPAQGQTGGQPYQPRNPAGNQGAGQQQYEPQDSRGFQGPADDFDDDIPF